jgi:stress-induced-phosphoprotein 1
MDPANENVKSDLESVRKKSQQADKGENDFLGQMFQPALLDALRFQPQTAPLFNDPGFVAMVNDIKASPKNAEKYHQDPRFQQLLQAVLTIFAKSQGMDIGEPPGPAQDEPTPPPQPKAERKPEAKPAAAPTATPVSSNADAENEKNLGNQAFKAGNLDQALVHYNRAIELEPYNVTYCNNKVTVLTHQKQYKEAIDFANDAIAKGREHGASYEAIARAYQKIAICYNSLGDLEQAIEALKASILEKKDPQVQKELKKMQDKWEKQKAQAYENPELSEQAKNDGNMAFKNGDFPKAIDFYTEAIKRAPRNPALYSNRAAAYSKLGEMPMAVKDCERALELDPVFVKAYTRKAYCHYAMKEYYKARDCYNEALRIDPNNAEAVDGLQSIDVQIAKNRYTAPDEEQLRRAAADPEIQRILSDPGMQQILRDCQENPTKMHQYMSDPSLRDAFMKLQAAGFIR